MRAAEGVVSAGMLTGWRVRPRGSLAFLRASRAVAVGEEAEAVAFDVCLDARSDNQDDGYITTRPGTSLRCFDRVLKKRREEQMSEGSRSNWTYARSLNRSCSANLSASVSAGVRGAMDAAFG